MQLPRTFLVVAEDTERLFLISNTLHRKFPNAVVQTCRDSEAAIAAASAQRLDAIVAQRSTDLDEIPLVRRLRGATRVPIVLMAAWDHAERAKEAGATRFVNQDEWLTIGTAVAVAIAAG